MKRALLIDCGDAAYDVAAAAILAPALRACGWETATLAVPAVPATPGAAAPGAAVPDDRALPLSDANVRAALLWLTDAPLADGDALLLYVRGPLDGASLTLTVDGVPLRLPPMLVPRIPRGVATVLLLDPVPACAAVSPVAMPPFVGVLAPAAAAAAGSASSASSVGLSSSSALLRGLACVLAGDERPPTGDEQPPTLAALAACLSRYVPCAASGNGSVPVF